MKRLALILLSGLLLLASGALAQEDAEAIPEEATPALAEFDDPALLGAGVPRGTVALLLAAMDENDWEVAAEYLDLRNLPSGYATEDGPRLAEYFSEVLERKLWIDIDNLSAVPEGASDDGLPSYRDLLGRIEDQDRVVELYVQRIPDGDGGRIWKISTATVALIPELHTLYGQSPIVDAVEDFLPQGEFLGVEFAKWVIVLSAMMLIFLLGRPLMSGIAILTTPADSPYRSRVRNLLRGPLLFLLVVVVCRQLLQHMGIGVTAQGIERAGTLLTIMLVWVAFSIVNLVRDVMAERMRSHGQSDATALLRPGTSGIKVVIFLVAVVAWLENLGFNVTTLIAGLGVGGVAVALALQRPLEDLIAAITLYSQQIIKTGDFCHFGDVRGTVEEIGLRNTRIRTLRNTVISIPNSRVVHESIDNFAAREKFLYETILSLAHDTSATQLRNVLAGLVRVAEEHPKVHEGFRIRFAEFGGVSFDIKVFLYIDTRQIVEFQAFVEELNLAFMDVIDGEGARFAERMLIPQ